MVNRKTAKTTSSKTPVPAAAPVKAVEQPVVEQPVVETVEVTKTKKEETTTEFANILEELENMKKQISKVITSVKALQKSSNKKTLQREH